ncbi:hypothetical protein [Calothrix sp. NIES-2100]|uniref:hypothetical protein n=1 Tax=Calothrix sp. NIES-2100 TaxID=1954172 RepID=UPI0030DC72A8
MKSAQAVGHEGNRAKISAQFRDFLKDNNGESRVKPLAYPTDRRHLRVRLIEQSPPTLLLTETLRERERGLCRVSPRLPACGRYVG